MKRLEEETAEQVAALTIAYSSSAFLPSFPCSTIHFSMQGRRNSCELFSEINTHQRRREQVAAMSPLSSSPPPALQAAPVAKLTENTLGLLCDHATCRSCVSCWMIAPAQFVVAMSQPALATSGTAQFVVALLLSTSLFFLSTQLLW